MLNQFYPVPGIKGTIKMNKMLNKLCSYGLILSAFLVVAGCVTQKKKEDVSKLGKAYHNMTARYNGYYNATVLLNESILNLESQYQENYKNILPVYKYVEADNPKAVAEPMDNAIKKVSAVVNLHRVSHWADDCYLLMGQAQYLKQDYESAEETLEFMLAEYNPREMAKRETKSKIAKASKKAIKKGETPKTEDGEPIKLTKKQKEKLAKQKRKTREKERKQKLKEAKKNRKKKGKQPPKSKTETETEGKTVDKSTPKDKQKEEPASPQGPPAPGSISLGNLDAEVVESNPEKYFLKHRPAYQIGVLWLARTYIERENYSNAERLLTQLERSPSTFDDVRRDAAVAKACFYLKQKKYDQAVEPLETAISLVKDRPFKARLAFILGQIHQQAKRNQPAAAAFEKVIKNNPPFEMEFTARLNLAKSGAGESIRNLERMLKEEKNAEYKDQIYFALAQIALENGNRKEAIKNLELSLLNSSRNTTQKTESYLLLADLYFEDQNFVSAKLYYDSTLQVMNNVDERHKRVSAMAANLQDIAQNINTIALQDSLLRISRMTSEEQKELAARIFKQREEERLKKLREQASAGTDPTAPKGFQPPDAKDRSKFWAYDEKEVKRGERDFERKWGSRELSDNWRRSTQQSIAAETDESRADGGRKTVLTEEEIREIFKDVPDTPEKVAAADRLIESALFALGSLFRDRIQNYPKSVESLQELLRRYPESQYQLDALYYLYLSYKDLGDEANAQLYFDKIVNGFPNSNYARILQDPDYIQRVLAKENSLTNYYDETYAAFEQNRYQEAFDRISKVPEKFGSTNKLQPRFALLSAMCVGNLQGKEPYVEALKDVIAKYPDAPEAARAREIMRLLGEAGSSGPGQQRNLPKSEGQVGNYVVANEQLHYVVVVFMNDISLNDAKVIVSDYNSKYHNLQKLRMNNIFLGEGDSKYPLIAIRRFKDAAEAMDYYRTIQKNQKDFLDKNKYQYEVMPISQDNYRELLRAKDLAEYKTFFELNYLK